MSDSKTEHLNKISWIVLSVMVSTVIFIIYGAVTTYWIQSFFISISVFAFLIFFSQSFIPLIELRLPWLLFLRNTLTHQSKQLKENETSSPESPPSPDKVSTKSKSSDFQPDQTNTSSLFVRILLRILPTSRTSWRMLMRWFFFWLFTLFCILFLVLFIASLVNYEEAYCGVDDEPESSSDNLINDQPEQKPKPTLSPSNQDEKKSNSNQSECMDALTKYQQCFSTTNCDRFFVVNYFSILQLLTVALNIFYYLKELFQSRKQKKERFRSRVLINLLTETRLITIYEGNAIDIFSRYVVFMVL